MPAGEVAAILVEPIQGEGGYLVPPDGFLQGLRELCDRHGILLIFDEVQSGVGRTGRMFASQHWAVSPDIMTLAKGLGSGLPIGLMVARRRHMEKWQRGAHGNTYGGNPISCAAALATLELVEHEYMANAASVGEYFTGRLRDLRTRFGCIGEVRGKGLMIGTELVEDRISRKPAPALVDRCSRGPFTMAYFCYRVARVRCVSFRPYDRPGPCRRGDDIARSGFDRSSRRGSVSPSMTVSPPATPRILGFWTCTALVIGNTIGIGVFLLPAALAPYGLNALWAWAITIVGCVFLAIVFSGLARTFPQDDGPYAYTERAFGPGVSFFVLWCYWFSSWVTNATIAIGVVGYLASLVPVLQSVPWLPPYIALVFVWLFVLVNCLGIRAAAWTQVLTTVLKLLPQAAIIILGVRQLLADPVAFTATCQRIPSRRVM